MYKSLSQAKTVALSQFELDLIVLVCNEYDIIEIAGILSYPICEIKKRLDSLIQKSDCRNEVGLALFAFYNGII